MSKPLMLMTSLVLIASCMVVRADEKSFQFRGQRVRLTEANDLLLVKSAGTKSAKDVATAAVRAQAKVLGRDSGAAVLQLVRTPAAYSSALGGMLVPRLGEVKAPQLAEIARESPDIESVHMVYRSGTQPVVPMNTLSVRFKGAINPRLLFAISSEFDLKTAARPKYASGVVQFEVPAGADSFKIANALAAKDFVQWAQPDLGMKLNFLATIPNDEHFAKQWHMQPGEGGPQVPEAWAITLGTSDIKVAVIDTGVDLTHPDLLANLVEGYDFVDDDPKAQPDTDSVISPHGTSCSGVVAATGSNGEGISGVAPLAKLMPIRIADRQGFTTDDKLAESISFAASGGAKVISCSWGGGPPSNLIADAIDTAVENGALVVFAAGNSGPNGAVAFPGKYEKVLCVGATNDQGKLANFSSFLPGGEVDITAPGQAIFTCDVVGADGYFDGQVESLSDVSGDYMPSIDGTSFACPFVAGVAALVWSAFPELTAAQVRDILEETAVKTDQEGGDYQDGYSNKYGHGLVNALAALNKAAQVTGKAPLGQPLESSGDNNDNVTSRVGSGGSNDGGVEGPWGTGAVVTSTDRDGARRNPREILTELLKLRKSLDGSGLPPRTKALGDLEEIELREKQLADLFQPLPQTYSFRGKSVVLSANESWVAMLLPEAGPQLAHQFWRVIDHEAGDKIYRQISMVGSTEKAMVVLVPRSAMRSREELANLAKTGGLPPLMPVYTSGDSMLVPTGIITARLKADTSAADRKSIVQSAEAKGLQLISSDGDLLRFALSNRTGYSNVFPAVRSLALQSAVLWCEPDLAKQVVRLNE